MKEPIKSNYHTHIYLCRHATGTMDDYILKAIRLGYKTVAITDHIPFTNETQEFLNTKRMSMDDFYNIYLKDAKRVKETYSKDITVLIGLESEYLDFLKPFYEDFLKEIDFMLLGQHYLKVNDEYRSVYDLLTEQDVERYADVVEEAIKTGYFSFIAHPEIFLWGRLKWDKISIAAAKRIIACSVKYDIPLELNANGLRHCIRKDKTYVESEDIYFAYPNVAFLKLAKEAGAKFLINDDCHDLKSMCDDATLEAYEMAERLELKLIDKLELKNKFVER